MDSDASESQIQILSTSGTKILLAQPVHDHAVLRLLVLQLRPMVSIVVTSLTFPRNSIRTLAISLAG
jgi:hypothetical protein